MGTGILIVWTDVAAEIETDFNEWYNREHLPDRILRMPGFLRGRRYVADAASMETAGAPKFLTGPCVLRLIVAMHAPAMAKV